MGLTKAKTKGSIPGCNTETMQKHLDTISIYQENWPTGLASPQVGRPGSVELKSTSGLTTPAMER